MSTPANGHQAYVKPAQFLTKGEEIYLAGGWFTIKQVTVYRDRVKVKFTDGAFSEYAPHVRLHVRRPAQWIAPSHTGVSWSMPGGAGQP